MLEYLSPIVISVGVINVTDQGESLGSPKAFTRTEPSSISLSVIFPLEYLYVPDEDSVLPPPNEHTSLALPEL